MVLHKITAATLPTAYIHKTVSNKQMTAILNLNPRADDNVSSLWQITSSFEKFSKVLPLVEIELIIGTCCSCATRAYAKIPLVSPV